MVVNPPMINAIDFSAVDWGMLGICIAFIVADIVAGVLKACFKGEFSSSTMREGLQHKAGTMLILLVCGLCDVATANTTVALDIPIGVLDVFGALVVMMELGSIIENCIAMNPDLGALPLFKIFGVTKSEEKDSK